MNRDLEETLNELGPDYRAVVARLRGAGEAQDLRPETLDEGRLGSLSKVFRLRSKVLRPVLAAASLLVLAGFGIHFARTLDLRPKMQDAGFGAREYRATVPEMIATQNPDGSWQNDFMTRRNAAALKLCGEPAAQVAYKKAMRNLRVRGVL